jgi:hypothetical protein
MIKKFNNFIKESMEHLQKEEVIDIFQDYLDEFDEDKIVVKFNKDLLFVEITHTPWLKGIPKKDHFDTFAKNWTKIAGRVKMIQNFGYKIISFNYTEDGSPNSPCGFKFSFSTKQDSGQFLAFKDIPEWNRYLDAIIFVNNKLNEPKSVLHNFLDNNDFDPDHYIVIEV